jgi:predicted AAA+ superfamily ATPase
VAPRFFSLPGGHEIDFLIQDGAGILPIEVKSGEAIKANSFKAYIEKFSPRKAVMYSKLQYQINDRFTNIPLYLAWRTKDLI